jgi:hypothetical protein
MVITIFIYILTWSRVDHLDLLPKPCSKSTLKLGFKIIFILTLIRINLPTRDLGLALDQPPIVIVIVMYNVVILDVSFYDISQ